MGNHVEGATHGVPHQPSRHGVRRHSIHQQETTGVPAPVVGIHRDGTVRGNFDSADVVHLKYSGGALVPGHDIESVANVRYRRGNRAGARHEKVGPTMGQGLFTDPHHVGGETVCWLQGRAIGILPRQHISAGDVDLVIEGDGHRLAGDG